MARKYFLDWLRVFAFACLIVFHVGCLYASWDYNLKSPWRVAQIDWFLLALTPWRMVLLFMVSGVASRYLLEKLGAGGFVRDRLRRLVPVILVGMLIVIPPQTYIMLRAKGLLQEGYLHFWWFSYLAADQTLVAPLHRTVPTYDHLWFIVYLLIYALILGAVAGIVGRLMRPTLRPPLLLLLVIPLMWLAGSNFLIERYLPVTFYLPNDWGSHLKWAGVFVTGVAWAKRPDVWDWFVKQRSQLAVAAGIFLALQMLSRALWLNGAIEPLASALWWSAASSLYAATMLGALCGYAMALINRPSPTLAHLNEAILPVYVLHQPVLLVSAFYLFPFQLPPAVEALLLTAITAIGALALYELAIRPFRIVRILFGLKPRSPAT